MGLLLPTSATHKLWAENVHPSRWKRVWHLGWKWPAQHRQHRHKLKPVPPHPVSSRQAWKKGKSRQKRMTMHAKGQCILFLPDVKSNERQRVPQPTRQKATIMQRKCASSQRTHTEKQSWRSKALHDTKCNDKRLELTKQTWTKQLWTTENYSTN